MSALGRAILSGDIGLSDDERALLGPLAEDLILSVRPLPSLLYYL